MNKDEILDKLYDIIENKFQEFKERVVDDDEEDYCEEMALMYSFRKFIQYLQHNDTITENELKTIYEFGLENFIEEFMETFWNSDLGNSYDDITTIIKTTIESI